MFISFRHTILASSRKQSYVWIGSLPGRAVSTRDVTSLLPTRRRVGWTVDGTPMIVTRALRANCVEVSAIDIMHTFKLL